MKIKLDKREAELLMKATIPAVFADYEINSVNTDYMGGLEILLSTASAKVPPPPKTAETPEFPEESI
jgi:hypothetical protein